MPVTQDHLSSIKATQCEWRPVTGINICNMMMWMMIIMLWGWKIRYRRLSRRERCRVRWHKGAAPLLWVDIVLPAGMTTHCFHRTQYRIVLTPISWGACPNFAFKAGSLNHWLKKRLGDRSSGWIGPDMPLGLEDMLACPLIISVAKQLLRIISSRKLSWKTTLS